MSRSTHLLKNIIIIMLLSVVISKGIMTIVSNPPWQAADEAMFLEAALVTGKLFPNVLIPAEHSDPALQQSILKCMDNHGFFLRVGIPRPLPIPAAFGDAVFLRDAPSKLGREPLFYLCTGIPMVVMTDGILEALYLGRLICLLMAISGFLLCYLSLRHLHPRNIFSQVLPLFFMAFHPTFWHYAASFNSEAWKFLIICAGFYLMAWQLKFRSKLTVSSILTAYLLAAVFTRWTLIPLVLIIILTGLLRSSSSEPVKSSSHSRIKWGLIGTAIGSILLLGLMTMSPHLFLHEFQHIRSGLLNLASSPERLLPMLNRLYETFWFGFGWLNIPVSASVRWLSTFVTVIFSALIFCFALACFNKSFRRKQPEWATVLLTISVLFMMVAIRACSQNPAIQGRYLFPILPFLAIAVSGILLQQRWLLKTLGIILVVSMCSLDLSANIKGWFNHQHIKIRTLDTRVKALACLGWNSDSTVRVDIETNTAHSDSFLISGWYPREAGSQYRWMLNKATVALPLLQQQESTLSIDFTSFFPGDPFNRSLEIRFNGHDLLQRIVSPTDHRVSIHLPKAFINRRVNILELSVDGALSPRDTFISSDSRYLTIAVKQIRIIPNRFLGKPSTQYTSLPGWFVSSSQKGLIQLHSANDIRIEDIGYEDYIEFEIDGQFRQLWWNQPMDKVVTDQVVISDISLGESISNTQVANFRYLKESVRDLPAPLDDVYIHLLLLSVWIFLSILAATLLIMAIIMSPLLDHHTAEC